MRDVIADWFKPVSEDDGYEPSEFLVDLPIALREWYLLCGKRKDIWSTQDHMHSPSELQRHDGFLTLIVENQSCAVWGLPLSELHNDDPPVFVDMSAKGDWVQENSTLSEFALQMLAFNIKWSDEMFWANGCSGQLAYDTLCSSYERIPFPDWNWPVHPTRFFGTRDLIVETNGIGDDIWFWIAARTKSAYQDIDRLLKPVGIQWEAEKAPV